MFPHFMCYKTNTIPHFTYYIFIVHHYTSFSFECLIPFYTKKTYFHNMTPATTADLYLRMLDPVIKVPIIKRINFFVKHILSFYTKSKLKWGSMRFFSKNVHLILPFCTVNTYIYIYKLDIIWLLN